MKMKIKDFEGNVQKAITKIIRSGGWDGRKVNVYVDNRERPHTVVLENKDMGYQLRIDDINEIMKEG